MSQLHPLELEPITYTLPRLSVAMSLLLSLPLPPRKVFQIRLPSPSSLATNASVKEL